MKTKKSLIGKIAILALAIGPSLGMIVNLSVSGTIGDDVTLGSMSVKFILANK